MPKLRPIVGQPNSNESLDESPFSPPMDHRRSFDYYQPSATGNLQSYNNNRANSIGCDETELRIYHKQLELQQSMWVFFGTIFIKYKVCGFNLLNIPFICRYEHVYRLLNSQPQQCNQQSTAALFLALRQQQQPLPQQNPTVYKGVSNAEWNSWLEECSEQYRQLEKGMCYENS